MLKKFQALFGNLKNHNQLQAWKITSSSSSSLSSSSSSSSSPPLRHYNHCRSPVTKVKLSKLSRSNGTVVCLFMAIYTGTNNCGDVRLAPMTKKAAARAALVEKQHKRTNKQTIKQTRILQNSLMLWPQRVRFINPLNVDDRWAKNISAIATGRTNPKNWEEKKTSTNSFIINSTRCTLKLKPCHSKQKTINTESCTSIAFRETERIRTHQ